MLILDNVCKNYGQTKVLENVSFTVKPLTIVGLMGPSGSGKSTLLRCIQGLEGINSGKISFEGKIGFMFQDFQLFPHMTVFENLTYAPNLYTKKEDNKKYALHILETLKISEKSNYLPQELSGGQKQRVALARSLMMKPMLLLCDEPTSGLDTEMTENIALLLKSVRESGASMIISSHDDTFLDAFVDTVIYLNDGKVVDIKQKTDSKNNIM